MGNFQLERRFWNFEAFWLNQQLPFDSPSPSGSSSRFCRESHDFLTFVTVSLQDSQSHGFSGNIILKWNVSLSNKKQKCLLLLNRNWFFSSKCSTTPSARVGQFKCDRMWVQDLLGLFVDQNERFPYPYIYSTKLKSYPFVYTKAWKRYPLWGQPLPFGVFRGLTITDTPPPFNHIDNNNSTSLLWRLIFIAGWEASINIKENNSPVYGSWLHYKPYKLANRWLYSVTHCI